MLWHYEALESDRSANDSVPQVATALRVKGRRGSIRRGEVSAESAAEARAALRSAGLSVLSVRPIENRPSSPKRAAATHNDHAPPRVPADSAFQGWLRGRRVQARADALDAIAMLLDSGVPLLQAFETLTTGDGGRDLSSRLRRTLMLVREDLRAGLPLPGALRRHPGWFDPVEVALIDAAESGGGLAPALRELADRNASSAKLTQKLIGALTYPAIVAMVGVAVALFLALRTLPQLTAVLTSSRIETPVLTSAVMAIGGFVVRWGWSVIAVTVLIVVMAVLLGRLRYFRRWSALMGDLRDRLQSRVPLVTRRMAVARVSLLIADLLRAGIPLVDALRLAAPSCRGLASGLGSALVLSAERIERGQSFVESLSPAPAPGTPAPGPAPAPGPGSRNGDSDPRARQFNFRGGFRGGWFDREFLQLIAVGEASGELAPVLERIGRRYERQAARLIDRLASVLEPATIVLLATFVGIVVMAAVLPLVRLQEVLR